MKFKALGLKLMIFMSFKFNISDKCIIKKINNYYKNRVL